MGWTGLSAPIRRLFNQPSQLCWVAVGWFLDEKAQHYVSVTQSWDNTSIIIVSETTLLPSSFIAKFVRGAAADQKYRERSFFQFQVERGILMLCLMKSSKLQCISCPHYRSVCDCVCVKEKASSFHPFLDIFSPSIQCNALQIVFVFNERYLNSCYKKHFSFFFYIFCITMRQILALFAVLSYTCTAFEYNMIAALYTRGDKVIILD